MSEIPFVNQLGDAFDAAIVAPRPARRRRFARRRLGVLALAVLLLGATGATVARIVFEPEQLAAGSIGCYQSADLSGDISVLSADGRSPVAVCSEVWAASGRRVPALVACSHEGGGVAVIPGRRCEGHGLAPLPVGYGLARARVARLAREVGRLEASADCIEPRELVLRAQALLDRLGWGGWRAVLRPGEGGPCGRLRERGGTPRLVLGSALDGSTRTLAVTTGPPRSLDELLYGEHSLAVRLMDASGERCFTVAGLEAYARRSLARAGGPVSFRLGRMPANTGVEPPRGDRYAEECAIVVGVAPTYAQGGEVGVEVEIWRKGG